MRLDWRKYLPLLVIAAGFLAYHNSFTGPFLFDDETSIVGNPRIRHLWPPWAAMGTILRRPIVELSFAINYALGGLNVWGYHAVNLAIHLLAAQVLYGIVLRTLVAPIAVLPGYPVSAGNLGTRSQFQNRNWVMSPDFRQAHWQALAVASIWVVHPLNTQAVDYIVQRSESMMGLFYLLTLYCVICGAENWGHDPNFKIEIGSCPQFSNRGMWWSLAAVVSCALGMGTKQVMVTAPVAVLLYDRIFLAGSFRQALRRRAGLYAGLAMTWVLLAVLHVYPPGKSLPGVGFDLRGITPLDYAATQPGVILHYLKLAIWPHPLVLDYGWPVAQRWMDMLPPILAIGGLVLASVWAWMRFPKVGFLGICFFLILAPTSSVVPLEDVAFEQRMYLSLAALTAGAVMGGWELLRRFVPDDGSRRLLAGAVVVALVTGLGWITVERNKDYRSGFSIWHDVVVKQPSNPRGHCNLGVDLYQQGKLEEAVACYKEALKLKPHYADAHYNLGVVMEEQGQPEEASKHYRRALAIMPTFAKTHNNLGNALVKQGKLQEAIEHYEQAMRLDPGYADPHGNLGVILAGEGKFDEAIAYYLEALRLNPSYAMAHYNLALALAGQGKYDQAIGRYVQALKINPDYADAHNNLGILLAQNGKEDEARAHYEEALRIKPGYTDARINLGNLLFHQGKLFEAKAQYGEALRRNPNLAEAHNNLGVILAREGAVQEAMSHYAQALQLKPDYPDAQRNMERALRIEQRQEESAGKK